jgi:hypothetical protein
MGGERNETGVRLPTGMVTEARGLVPAMQAAPAYAWASVNATTVLRRALQLGLQALREELHAAEGVGGTVAPPLPPAPAPPRQAPRAPSPPAAAPEPVKAPAAATPEPSRPSTAPRKSSREKPPATVAGRKIRAWRQAERLDQAAAGERAGVSGPTISRVELGGATRRETLDRLVAVVPALAAADFESPA